MGFGGFRVRRAGAFGVMGFSGFRVRGAGGFGVMGFSGFRVRGTGGFGVMGFGGFRVRGAGGLGGAGHSDGAGLFGVGGFGVRRAAAQYAGVRGCPRRSQDDHQCQHGDQRRTDHQHVVQPSCFARFHGVDPFVLVCMSWIVLGD